MATALATDARASRLLGVGCIALVVSLAAWTALVAGGGHGRSSPVVLLLAGLAGAVALGHRLAAWPGLVPKSVAAGIGGALLLTFPGVLGAGGAPTGYANSNATLAAVGVVAAVAAARQAPAGAERQMWTAAAGGLTLAALVTRSAVGIAVLFGVAALWLIATRITWPPLVAAGGAVGVGLALALTVAVAVQGPGSSGGADVVRVGLWSAAVDLAHEQPISGLGPGAFEERNPVTADEDLRWVHHEYLELVVELGGVGLVLVVALGLAVLARLAVAGSDGTAAAAAFTVVALHGTVDHVWHAPAVLVVLALLVGDGTGSQRRSRQPPRSAAGSRPGWA